VEARDPLSLSIQTVYRRAVELSQQIPWISDPEGRILYIGPGWADVIDASLGDLLGRGWTSLIRPDDLARVIETRRATLSKGEPYECEYRIRVADGSYRWFRVRAGAQRDESGQIQKILQSFEPFWARARVSGSRSLLKELKQAHRQRFFGSRAATWCRDITSLPPCRQTMCPSS